MPPQASQPQQQPPVNTQPHRPSSSSFLAAPFHAHRHSGSTSSQTLGSLLGSSSNPPSTPNPAANSKGISKFKLFSKFSFAKESYSQQRSKPTQSILSNSIKEQELKEREQQRQHETEREQPLEKQADCNNNEKAVLHDARIINNQNFKPVLNNPSEVSLTTCTNSSDLKSGFESLALKEREVVLTSSSSDNNNNMNNNNGSNSPAHNLHNMGVKMGTISQYPPPRLDIEDCSSIPKRPSQILGTTPLDQPQLPASPILNSNSNSISNSNPMSFANSALNTPKASMLIDSDSDSDSDTCDEFAANKLKSEESIRDYCPGGYHPTFIGETYGTKNQYLVVRKLGWGHFSTVWLAWDSLNSRHVAIKIVRSSANYSEAAMDEIKLLETVNSKDELHGGKKHIVQLLDHFVHEGPNGKHVCMIFEVLGENMLNLLVRYKDFQNCRQKEIDEMLENGEDEKRMEVHISNLHDLHILSESYGGLPLTLVKQISKQILLALDYLHRECGIIHTDIKPENVLVEIHDVEKLVQLLEFERKSKKMNKLIKQRENDTSHCIHHPNSFSASACIPKPAQNSITHSLSSSISTHRPLVSNSLGASSVNNINNCNDINNSNKNSFGSNINTDDINFENRYTSRSRKNSIPVRTSKPLTSPVETSTVNNFFRSFSFSQKRGSSFSSNMANYVYNNNNNTTNGSVNVNSSVLNNNSGSLDRKDSITSSLGQSKFSNKLQDIDKIDEDENEEDLQNQESLSKPAVLSKSVSNSSESEEDDIFVDATEPILSFSPREAQHIKSTSIASIDSLQTIPNTLTSTNSSVNNNNTNTTTNSTKNGTNKNVLTAASALKINYDNNSTCNPKTANSENLVPFPSPHSSKNSKKPSLSIDTSIAADEKERETSTVFMTSHPSILDDFDELISIKIADLGNSCWYNKHYTSDIQTRQYRAPEVILKGDWGCSTDIWSTACLIFELITSDYLFDPKSAASYSRDDDHLAQIIELLQSWPTKEYLRSCSKWRDFFDKSGQNFRKIGKLKIWPLKTVLIDEYRMSDELATEVSDFLLPMLSFDPSNRVDAGSMCSHPWIKDVNCGFDLGRKYGLRGEDIKGWSEEWE